MARTAPVPNIPVIPGMNPGIFVMGGGGAGGGSGGKGGRGQGGPQGANGDGGGDGADGSCGGAGTSGCGHPSHNPNSVAGGDPVDVATGVVFTLPATDVGLAGPHALTLHRFYRSDQLERDVGFGPGWSHSFAWGLAEGRRFLTITRPDGTTIEVSRLAPGQRTVGGSGTSVECFDFGYVVATPRFHVVFKAPPTGGPCLPTAIVDAFGNATELLYDRGLLHEIRDPVGRRCRLYRDRAGRIESVACLNAAASGRWTRWCSYRYDEAGRLIERTDHDGGAITSFGYDDAGRMTWRRTPGGATFRYRYDGAGRCIETWGEAEDGFDLGLSPTVAARLPDGSPARGIYPCRFHHEADFVEMVTPRGLNRYSLDAKGCVEGAVNGSAVHTRELDDQAHLVSYTDPLGNQFRYERDALGRPLAVSTPDGALRVYERNDAGALQRYVDGNGHATEIEQGPGYLRWRDPLGASFEVQVDARGDVVLVGAPNGSTTRFVRDAHGNVVEELGRNGEVTRYTYDYFGRCTTMEDAAGGRASYVYSLRGRLLRATAPDGSVSSYHYDADGRLVEAVHAHRARRYEYSAAGWLRRILFADGRAVVIHYDREGLVVAVENAAGEVHELERDSRGLVFRERTFDGRTIDYQHDALGRVVAVSEGDDRVEYEHDEVGRLVRRTGADGRCDEFAYDLEGNLELAQNAETKVTIGRNEVGWVTTETHDIEGDRYEVALEFDPMGKIVEERSSCGHAATFVRDPYGFVLESHLAPGVVLHHRRDGVGREVQCRLPGGHWIETRYDAAGRMVRRDFRKHTDGASDGTHLALAYDAHGEVSLATAPGVDNQRFEYDPEGRLLRIFPQGAMPRLFAFGPNGGRFSEENGGPRERYGPGGRLLEDARGRYRYDSAGRRAGFEPRNERDERDERDDPIVAYRWSADGKLLAVATARGRRIVYTYDALDRRVRSREHSATGGLERETHFVWSQHRLLHDVTFEIDANGTRRRVRNRTFFIDDSGTPMAQRTVDGTDRTGRVPDNWTFALRDHRGVATAHLSRSGTIVATTPSGAWGEAAPVADGNPYPFGLPGQYRDDVGLIYNRHRYYDADTGTYISPDPIGLAGGLAPYLYANGNPMRFVDRDGLMPTTTVVGADGKPLTDRHGNPLTGHSSSTSEGTRRRGRPGYEQPVVGDSLPRADTWVDHDGNVGSQGRAAGPCAEADLLRAVERDTRERHPRRANESPEDYNARIRDTMRGRLRGSRIETRDDKGNLMAPCPTCARMFDDVLGPDLARETVQAPDSRGNAVPWDGVTTQARQGGPLAPRPDDRRESALREQMGGGYQLPAERGAAIEQRSNELFRENYPDMVRDGELSGRDLRDMTNDQARSEVESSGGYPPLNDDGSLAEGD